MENAVKKTKDTVAANKYNTSAKVNLPEPFVEDTDSRVKFMLAEIELASDSGKSSIKFFRNSAVDEAAIEEIKREFSVEEIKGGGGTGSSKTGWLVTW